MWPALPVGFVKMTSWWLNQSIWKICSSNWIISKISRWLFYFLNHRLGNLDWKKRCSSSVSTGIWILCRYLPCEPCQWVSWRYLRSPVAPSQRWVLVQVKANDARAASTNHRVLAEPPEDLGNSQQRGEYRGSFTKAQEDTQKWNLWFGSHGLVI